MTQPTENCCIVERELELRPILPPQEYPILNSEDSL